MAIDDPYTAYCLDEACLYMVQQSRAGREPDFDRPARLARQEAKKRETTNSGALAMLAELGVTVR